MGSRGRRSGASLAVAAISPEGIAHVRRPGVPDELTSEQASEWRAIVNRLPADWFPRETWGLLAQYCRHVVAARRVAEMIETFETELSKAAESEDAEECILTMLSASKGLDRLLKMQEREGRAISSLATKMRISQQSSYDKTKKKPSARRRPWEE